VTSTNRRAAPFVLLALGIVVLGLVARDGRQSGDPLDPRSTDPLGARGLVLLLERFGAEVRIAGGVPPEGAVAVLLEDRLNEPETDRLEDWVEAGGTLVVADPVSSFVPALGRSSEGLFDVGDDDEDDGGIAPGCGLEALAGVGAIDVSAPAGYRVPPRSTGCFSVPGGSYLVATPSGEGTIVALGGAGPLVNERLDAADNAVLAVALMAPNGAGAGDRVVFVEPSVAGSGDRSLAELVSRRVKDGIWQLLVAFAVFALWRARRLGRPVLELQPVQIAGSELVVAVGNLLQQGRRREAAASMLRSDLRRTLSERLGVPLDAPPSAFAAAAAARTGADPAVVEAALAADPPRDDDALVALARSIESLRNEVAHAR
jgi:hypothetical protein